MMQHRCMKCPLHRRHHERYGGSLAVIIGSFEQSCAELSKLLKSTLSVGACGILLKGPKINQPSMRPANKFISSSYCSIRLCATPPPSDSPCFVWRGRVLVVTITATTRRRSNNPIVLLAAVLTMVGWWWLCRFYNASFGAIFFSLAAASPRVPAQLLPLL